MVQKFFLFTTILFLSVSCNILYQSNKMEYQGYKVNGTAKVDSSIYKMIQPYGDSLSAKMNVSLATLNTSVEKKQPNGSMGLLFVDIMRNVASTTFNKNIDVAILNNGGLRVPMVAAGIITVGKVYEIMPFDNILVLQTVKGTVLENLIQHICSKGGWPVSGITCSISNNKATNILINGKPIVPSNDYTIANSDYIANGGDDCTMLINQPTINNGVLIRDAFIQYFAMQGKNGKSINPINEQRITIQ
jgi:2',3'-cyclic-nucleotide 2'-phosphodiesterase (5'-nucleotidase family)